MELPNYSSQLMQQLWALRKEEHFCDCTILVGEGRHRAHKLVLAASSMLFRSLLDGSDTISIDTAVVSSQEFGCLLDMVYTGKLPPGKHNVSRIVAAADSLQMYDVAVGFKQVLTSLVNQKPPVSASPAGPRLTVTNKAPKMKPEEGEPEPSHNQDASSTLKRKAPSSPRSSSSPSSKTPRVPVHKLITLRSTAAPPGNGVAAPETAAAVVAVQSSSPQRAGTRSSSRVAPDKKASTALSPREQPRVTGASAAEEATDTNQEPPEHTADTKGTVSLLSLIFLSQVLPQHSKHFVYAQLLSLSHSHSGGCIRAPWAENEQQVKGLLRSNGKQSAHILQIKNVKSLKASSSRPHHPSQSIQRWHSCNECGKGFNFACQLEVHMRWHTKEKPYSCAVCRKSFTTVSMLKRHHRIHTGEKPFRCHVCGKCFNQSLEVHMRWHTKEKPYSCAVCRKSFTTVSMLKRHHRIHTGEKPFRCHVCGKCFNQSAHLNTHFRLHTRERAGWSRAPHCKLSQ
uniref:Uncharacterized protein n=1 Tax=Neolamprologus brichardi TaxID=32507 RepID=A0A3Q4IB06_NEOBR